MWIGCDGGMCRSSNTWGVFWVNQLHMRQNIVGRWASGRRVASAIRSLVIGRCLQLECARVLHETFLVPVLTCGSETSKKGMSRIRAVQINNLKDLVEIRRIDKYPNAQIKRWVEGLIKGVVLWWFAHAERMKNDRIARRVQIAQLVCRGRGELIP